MENKIFEETEVNVEKLQTELRWYKLLYKYEKEKNKVARFISGIDELLEEEKIDLVAPILKYVTGEEEP